MANGYWGNDWEALEEGLKRLDPVFEAFASTHGLTLSKNSKSPDRSYEWGQKPNLILQAYSNSELPARYTLWVTAFDHRSRAEYWKHRTLCEEVPAEELASSLKSHLSQGLAIARRWVDEYPG